MYICGMYRYVCYDQIHTCISVFILSGWILSICYVYVVDMLCMYYVGLECTLQELKYILWIYYVGVERAASTKSQCLETHLCSMFRYVYDGCIHICISVLIIQEWNRMPVRKHRVVKHILHKYVSRPYTYIQTYLYIHVDISIHTCRHIYTYISAYLYIHIDISIHTYRHIYTYIQTYLSLC